MNSTTKAGRNTMAQTGETPVQTQNMRNEEREKFHKLSEALKHLVSFQKAVDTGNSSFKFSVIDLVVVDKEEDEQVRITLGEDRIGIKLTGGKVPKFALEDGESALIYVNNPIFSDCMIRLGNECSFYSHKQYLMRRSKYFEAMLSNFIESSQKDISIEMLYPNVFKSVLEFIYSGLCDADLKREWDTNNDIYFSLMWSADYLQIDELTNLLLSNFNPKYKKSPLFNSQHFPISILERWIAEYCEVPAKPCAQTSILQARTLSKSSHQQPQLAYSEIEILELLFIWTANSQNQPEFAETISRLINKYKLLNSCTMYLVKRFLNKSGSALRQSLDPLGLISFVGDQYPNCNLYPHNRDWM